MKTKEVKQKEGKERQEFWDNLTVDQKLKILGKRPGEAKRQMKKYQKQVLVQMIKEDEKAELYKE